MKKDVMYIIKYILINIDANAMGKVKQIHLDKYGNVDRLYVKYKGDRTIF